MLTRIILDGFENAGSINKSPTEHKKATLTISGGSSEYIWLMMQYGDVEATCLIRASELVKAAGLMAESMGLVHHN